MNKPVHTKYFILIPTVLNIGVFYMLAQPLGWVQLLLTPAWRAVLMCCGVAMTGVMALAYVRLHQDIEASSEAAPTAENRAVAATSSKPATPVKSAADGGVYEAAESEEKAQA
jgi:hypothetical protein